MAVMKAVGQIVVLYGFYVLGNWIQDLFQTVVPGSLIGMALLFFLLSTGAVKGEWLEEGSGLLLSYLPLLFIPALVGVVEHVSDLGDGGWGLLVIVPLNTVGVMALSALFTRRLLGYKRKEGDE